MEKLKVLKRTNNIHDDPIPVDPKEESGYYVIRVVLPDGEYFDLSVERGMLHLMAGRPLAIEPSAANSINILWALPVDFKIVNSL